MNQIEDDEGSERERQAKRSRVDAIAAQGDEVTGHRVREIRARADVRNDLEPRADVRETKAVQRFARCGDTRRPVRDRVVLIR